MKPAVRLAQIELDTPNWQSNHELVAEVKMLRQAIGYGKLPCDTKSRNYKYIVYDHGQKAFEGTCKEVAGYLKISKQTVRNRAWRGVEGQKGSAKGIRIECVDLRKLEIEGEADEVV